MLFRSAIPVAVFIVASVCLVVDQCSAQSPIICVSPCLNEGTCTAPNICSCVTGWTGSTCETDENECAGNHGCAHVCTNTPGSYTCSCNTGYRLNNDDRGCSEINECNEDIDGCEHECTNTDGSYECSCRTGYTLSSDSLNCINNDECMLGTATCTQNCHDTQGSYTCSCLTGYSINADGFTCDDIDECTALTDDCSQNCHNTIGSYTCSCNDGYILHTNGRSCSDINECSSDSTNDCQQVCTNAPGSYSCACNSGYTLNPDGRGCTDINECSSDSTNDCQQVCTNAPGSYSCACNSGYTLNPDGRGCTDIDECAVGSHNCDHNCQNIAGSFTCSCNAGYSLDTNGYTCNDIDECAVGSHNCDHNCQNIAGSFTCSCNAGYSLDTNGYTCNDIDECAVGSHNCDHNCQNIAGSFTCSCNVGYSLDTNGYTCNDINECSTPENNCQQFCINTPGSFICACRIGYTLNSNLMDCLDVDECISGTHRCNQICHNTIGSYTCSCNDSFTINPDGRGCDDIDECSMETDQCNHTCVNVPGTYRCTCRDGYYLDADGFRCLDINECGGAHNCEQACNNTAGSFHCACIPGYILNDDGSTCRDLDECTAEVEECEQMCHNNVGSYTCSCNEAYYTLNNDGFRCNDINECLDERIGNTTCAEVCVNTRGAWYCDCFLGYTINTDAVTCRDLDECTEGGSECDQQCYNNVGSYTCSCNSTTTLNEDGFHCDDIDECEMNPNICGSICVNTYGTYHCACNVGYILNDDGVTCRDINECEDGTAPCEQLCNNTLGSYTCSCYSDYTLTSNLINCLGPPEDIYFSEVNSTNTMTLTWGTPANDSNDGTILSYTVTCSSDSDTNYGGITRTLLVNEERRIVLQNLRPYMTYNCCVSVYTDTARSLFSCNSEITLEDAPTGPPENIVINNDDPYSLTFNLESPLIPNGVITAYTYYLTLENGDTIVTVDTTVSETFTIGGFLPYQLVMVEVSANTSVGEGPKSNVDELRTSQATPSVPTGVVVEVINTSSIKIRWNPPAMANGVLLVYTVRVYNVLNRYYTDTRKQPQETRSVDVNDLSPYIPYTVEVIASTIIGDGELARQIIFTQHGVPNIPVVTTVVRISDSLVKVFWIPLTHDLARGVLTNLQIAYQPVSNGTCSTINEDKQLTTFEENIDTQSYALISGLETSMEYCIAIRVSTIAGESGFSNILKVQLPSHVFIQVRLKLVDSICTDYIIENTEQKATDISSAIVEELLSTCECSYSLDYVAHSRILCSSNENEVIYHSNLLHTDGKLATELMELVQMWIDSYPTIMVGGLAQEVDTYCRADVTQIGSIECVALNPTTATASNPVDIDNRIAIIGGSVAGGVVLLIIIMTSVVILLSCNRRRRIDKISDTDMTSNLIRGGTSLTQHTKAESLENPKILYTNIDDGENEQHDVMPEEVTVRYVKGEQTTDQAPEQTADHHKAGEKQQKGVELVGVHDINSYVAMC